MMASWAFVLSGLILVISVAVPSKRDILRLKISSAGSKEGLFDTTESLVDTGPESDSTAIAGEVDKNAIAKDDERTVISNEDDRTVIAKECNGSATDAKGDRTVTAKKDDRNVIVKENNGSVISKQDGKSAIVTERDRPVTPKNDERTAIPTEASQPAVPKDDERTAIPTEASQPAVPKDDERTAIPKKPSKPITSKDDGRSAFPREGDEPFILNKDETESEMPSSLAQSEQKLAPDDLPADAPKGFEAGRGAQDKWLKENGHKLSAGDSKAMSRAIGLMKVFFSQTFKLTTNSTQNRTRGKTSVLHRKLLRNNKTGSEPFDKSRMEKAMSILAIFGENMETALTERQPEMRVESKESSPTATLSAWLEDVPDFLTSCVHVDGYDDHRWVQVVNVCPQHWSNQTILYLCKNVLINDYVMTDTPVQDSRGTVYANRFCALCNNVTKIRKWRIGWICEDENPVAPLFHPSETDDIMQMVTTLRRGNTCKLIRTPAITDAIRPCPSFSLREHHEMPVVNGGDRIPPGSGYPVSLNILMNFDFSGKTHIMFEDFYAEESYETKRCPRVNYVWDGDVGRCREVVCAKGFHFDDTYTTCIPNDGPGDSAHDDGLITDLSQLAQSNDIERVTLTVEVPSSYILIFLMTDYHQLWKSQIATQLNITINRIQKFNISVEEATGEANTLVIEKLSNEQLQQASAKTLEGVPLLKELPRWREGLGPQDYADEAEGDDDGVASSVMYVAVGDVLKDEDVDAETEALSDDDDGDGVASTVKYVAVGDVMKVENMDAETVALSDEDVLDASVESVTLSTHRSLQAGSSSRAYDTPMTVPAGVATTLAPRKNAKIIMTFILLPPESFRSGEQRSGPLVEELSSLVSKGELKFTINGTSLKVDNMAEEDNVEVFRPACPNGLLLVLDGEQIQLLYESDPETGHNITMLMDLRTGKVYPRGMFDVSFLVTQPLGNTTQKPHSFVYNALACEMPHIVNSQCKRIRIKADEYTIESTMKDLTFQNSTYNISSYEFVSDNHQKVEICVPDSYSGAVVRHPSRVRVYKNCGTGYEHWLQAEGYLTAVLGRVSIVALFSVLLTYFLFPKLRNLPGVNTMNLTCALFLAEIIFVTGEQVQIPWLCTAVAVCLHYCFLASHCWMNVMSYDVYRTFAGATCILTRVRDKKKFFPRYALYAWGTPLLVTGVCLFIDLSHVFSGISIGYGGTWSDDYNVTNFQNWPMEGTTTTTTTTMMTMMMSTTTTAAESVLTDNNASGRVADDEAMLTNTSDTSSGSSWSTIGGRSFSCWIQKPLAAMFAFGAPILLIFLVNCVLFSRTIASIRKTNRLARHSGAGRTSSSNSSRRLSGRNDVILYVKMASVMGFTWVFGLASSVISSVTDEPSDAICYALHVLGVLFPILNSSQGLFIFVAFVFNRRVLALYKSLGYKVRRFLLRQKEKFAVSAWGKKPMTHIATISRE